MQKREHAGMQHSILVVSASERFDAIVKRALQEGQFATADFRKNAAAARRRILECYYDIIVFNSPLPDESGIELALDTAEGGTSSLLLVVPLENYEDVLEKVTGYGVLAIPKPAPRGRIGKAIRLLSAIQDKMHSLRQDVAAAHEKMEELRVVGKAKCLLVGKKGMTEDDAHRYIGKQAMDNGVSRKRIAEKILEDLEG